MERVALEPQTLDWGLALPFRAEQAREKRSAELWMAENDAQRV